MRMGLTAGLCAGLALLAGACGGDDPPADVGGLYTLNVTNGANECMVQTWMPGEQSTGWSP